MVSGAYCIETEFENVNFVFFGWKIGIRLCFSWHNSHFSKKNQKYYLHF